MAQKLTKEQLFTNRIAKVYPNNNREITATQLGEFLDNFIESIFSDVTYTNQSATQIEVGGIGIGQTFLDKSFKEMWDQLLYPELFGTLTPPSSTFSSTITGFREVGENINITFSSTFNRGSINPQYESESQFRSGVATQFNYTGTGLSNHPNNEPRTVNDYTVLINGQSWTGSVSYESGVQPKGSNGTNFNSPLPAGTTSTITITITGVYPIFATTTSFTPSKLALRAHGSTFETTLVAETGSSKQFIEVPVEYGTLSDIRQYSDLSGNWETVTGGASTFTESTVTNDVQGNTINYRRYTHNGSTIGQRQIRFIF